VLLLLGVAYVVWLRSQALPAREDITAATPELIAQGKYIAQLGDCFACHTAANGPALAGGLPMETPFGTIYSTNITADPETGIGRFTFAQFDRAMRSGVSADGRHLYPAMPYPSYAKMTDSDMRALYAYLKFGHAPAVQANRPPEMMWPFSIRASLSLWNLLFLDASGFRSDPNKSVKYNRGAYLVEGLGHCGACHTPRGAGFQEKVLSAWDDPHHLFLSGAQVEGWWARSLRNFGDVRQTVELLRTGRNATTMVTGNMTDVIEHSTQYFSDQDLDAVATFLAELPDKRAVTVNKPQAHRPEALFTSKGGLGYLQFCSTCHRETGEGVANIFPPLAGNPTLMADDPSTLIQVTLKGWRTAHTRNTPRSFYMPGFAGLQDQELAEILSFVRENWGNGKGVTRNELTRARVALDLKPTELEIDPPRFAKMLDEPNAKQLVLGMNLNKNTRDLLPKHVGGQLNCTSCHLNSGTVAHASPYIGLSPLFDHYYASRAGREVSLAERINGCFRRSMNGRPLAADSDELKAMIAYFDWMKGHHEKSAKIPGRGLVKVTAGLIPNRDNGKKVYEAQCAVCHGLDGSGLQNSRGENVFPPLWGDQSFNIGAGMARTGKAAAFVKGNMPMGAHPQFPLGQGNPLSDQDVTDVAEYFTHQQRPDFPDKVKDWPKGDKPADARY
jgi:thiosulfate dehydrogenase